jgi:hypothetical protein
MPPFQAMPSAPPAPPVAPPAVGGAIPPPPGPAAPPAAIGGGADAAQQFALPKILGALQKAGVPPERWGPMLDNLPEPVKNNAATQIKMLHEQNVALRDWANLHVKEGQLRDRERQTDVREEAERRRREQGDAALQIKRDKESRLRSNAAAAAGGSAHLKTSELVYPRGADGRPDETQDPIGVRGITKNGKIITLDVNGNQVTPRSLNAGSAKESRDTKGSAQQNVRSALVKGSATNALRLLDEVEAKHPGATTSSYFGYHADNPLTKGLAAGAKGVTMSQKDRQIDAQWAGIIEEVGPVLSGGLRNSDAFRRFLIDQAPALGDDKATVKRKIQILRDNVAGTSKVFFNKFASNPSMWGTGVTPEQVEAAKGGGGAAPAGASQYQEGQTATNDKGEKIVFRGGKWQQAK